MGEWPSGQRQLTVNQPGYPYSGSNPLSPTNNTNEVFMTVFVFAMKTSFFMASIEQAASAHLRTKRDEVFTDLNLQTRIMRGIITMYNFSFFLY